MPKEILKSEAEENEFDEEEEEEKNASELNKIIKEEIEKDAKIVEEEQKGAQKE